MKHKQLASSTNLSPMDGEASGLQDRKKELEQKTEASLQNISKASTLTAEQAWTHGTNVQTAYRLYPAQTSVVLLSLLKDALTYLDYNKTIVNDQDLIDAVVYLREQFPVMKVEEWAIIMKRLKSGEFKTGYERLKLPELRDVFCQYEEQRASFRESNWGELKKSAPQQLDDEGLMRLYQQNKNRIEAEQKERSGQVEVKPVETDERGRWKAIPYPNDTEEHDGEKT